MVGVGVEGGGGWGCLLDPCLGIEVGYCFGQKNIVLRTMTSMTSC